MKRIVKHGEEDAEEAAGDAENRGHGIGHRDGDLLRTVLDVLGGAGVAEPRGELIRFAQALHRLRQVLEEVAHRSDERHEQQQHEDERQRSAVPRTVTVAASPRDIRVFAITKRTGYSKTSARKIPMKTMRKVSPIARNATAIPMTARMASSVRAGSKSSMRRPPVLSMAQKATEGCGWIGSVD